MSEELAPSSLASPASHADTSSSAEPATEHEAQAAFYESADFRLRATPKPHGRVLFEIECSPKYAEKLMEEATAQVRLHVAIPGFRKGKAPLQHVQKSYRPAIEQEWKRLLRDRGLSFAATQSGYTPLLNTRQLQVDIDIGKPDAPPFMRCTCDAMPPIPQIDLNLLQTHVTPASMREVTEEDKEKALKQLQMFHASWHEVDRPVAEGHCIQVEAVDPKQQQILKQLHWNTIHLDPRALEVPWVAALVGAKLNEERQCFPREESESDNTAALYAGGDPAVTVRITRIEEGCPHPLDDKLAEKAGCKDAAQLLERIEQNLQQHAFFDMIQARAADIKSALITHYPFEIPPILIRAQVEMRRPILDALPLSNEQKERVHGVEPLRARDFLHIAYLSHRYLREHNIQIAKEDLEEEFQHQQMNQNPLDRFIHDQMRPEVLRQQLILLVTARKGLYDILEKLYPETLQKMPN